MEEAVGTLSACISSGPDWPYILAQLYEGSNHTPLPKGKHLGILAHGKAEESPYGWISQLKVCQLLSAGPQVVYPMALNGGYQPVTINLPELLHSGSSITIDEHPDMRIDIPLPQGRWLLQKQSCPYPTSWRSQPCQLTLPTRQVWRRGRLPWRVTLSTFLPLWPHTAAAVVVQWWTSWNFR